MAKARPSPKGSRRISRDDVGVVQLCCRLDFSQEAVAHPRAGEHFPVQNLEDFQPIHQRISNQVDVSHSPPAEDPDDLVVLVSGELRQKRRRRLVRGQGTIRTARRRRQLRLGDHRRSGLGLAKKSDKIIGGEFFDPASTRGALFQVLVDGIGDCVVEACPIRTGRGFRPLDAMPCSFPFPDLDLCDGVGDGRSIN